MNRLTLWALVGMLGASACGRQPDHLKLKRLAQTQIRFVGPSPRAAETRWDLLLSNDRLRISVGGLHPFVQLSDVLATPFTLPSRLRQQQRSYRSAGRLYRLALGSLVTPLSEMVICARVDGVMHQPEYYSLSIQDKKLKLYGLLRTEKRIKVVQTYALHDGDRYLTIRSIFANLPSSKQPLQIQPVVRLTWCASSQPAPVRPRQPGTPLPPIVLSSGRAVVGWTGRGYSPAQLTREPATAGCVRYLIGLEAVRLSPGDEVTFDHSLHGDALQSALLDAMRRRQQRPGGWFVRRRPK